MRFEKPHSLSYHEQTFTSLPSMTFVRLESYSDDAGLWLKVARDERLVDVREHALTTRLGSLS
jgi:hypothetical protein